MNFKTLVSAGTLVVASATAGSAATYDLEDVTNGDSITNTLSVKTLDFIDFSFDAPDGFFVSALDISASSTGGSSSNFRPIVGLYSGTALVASNDSGASGGTATLSFSGAGVPAEGSYTLGIGGWISKFTNDITLAKSTAFFNNGGYTVSITPTISAVPLPAGGLLVLTGLEALALMRRKNRKA